MSELNRPELREKIAKLLYERHHPRMFEFYEDLKISYPSSAEGICQEADQILALIPDIEQAKYLEGYRDGSRKVEERLDLEVAGAKEQAKKEERERIISDLEAIDRDAADVRDFTRQVCELIVAERQALKGE